MTLIVVACAWVVAGTILAFLPMRFQYVPGILLLLMAPVLIYLVGRDFGFFPAAAAMFAFVSMFRNPLKFFARRALGQKPDIPK